MTSRIKAARKEREWSQTRLISELELVAGRRGDTLPSRETMKSRVSRWENGHVKPDEFYRRLLREALGMDDRELGFEVYVDEPTVVAADELLAKLAADPAVDDNLLGALRAQTDAIRRQDRQYGAGTLLEQMRIHVDNVETHLSHTVFESARRPLAVVLADAAALAGWQALDVVATDQAWRSFETASGAARQAEDPALYAFARMEQAHVLTELEQPGTAADLAESVWSETHSAVAPVVRCWLAAATAEMLAGHARGGDALAMIARAESEADAFEDDRPPYLVFNAVHLDRWIGHTLVKLADPAAERRLRQAADDMDGSFMRASASLQLDLYCALTQNGQKDEASEHLRRAEQLARTIGSRRQLARLRRLRAAS